MCKKKNMKHFWFCLLSGTFATSIVGGIARTSDYFDTNFQLLSSCKMKVYCTLFTTHCSELQSNCTFSPLFFFPKDTLYSFRFR